jgi:butyryl-CoA dehydrogenase
MQLELSEEQALFRRTARDFAEREVAPLAARVDELAEFPAETIKQMAGLGFMGVAVPAEYGGAGADTLCYVLALEEISRACASTGVIMSVNNSLVCDPLLRFGTEAQRRQLLTPLASGQRLGCFCLSEPEAGSDAANQQTRYRREGDRFVLAGTKNFITNGREADLAIVFATRDPALRAKGISAFLVEKGTPGFAVAKVEQKLGIRGSSCCQLLFDEVRVPAAHLLGAEGEGFPIAMATLDGGRIGIAAQAVGIAQAALDLATRHAKERVQFGKPIAEFQAIQFALADMATEIDAARLLAYRAALAKDRGGRYSREASMAKLFASEVAMRASTKAVQVLGGYGYLLDSPAQRLMRDAKVTEIYEGTSEVQRLVIASHLLR